MRIWITSLARLISGIASEGRAHVAVIEAMILRYRVAKPHGECQQIELPSGIRVTVDATVDADALSRVIGILTR